MKDFASIECTEMKWYVVKVQSNREKSVRDTLARRVKRDGLEDQFGEIVVPMEKVVENKAGKKRITEQKLFPGYLIVQMILNEDTWFLVRNTGGVGDFTGASGHPEPLADSEVNRILSLNDTNTPQPVAVKIGFKSGDEVKIKEGAFEGFSGMVDAVDESCGKVTVLMEIFGRPTPVDLESWQVESV